MHLKTIQRYYTIFLIHMNTDVPANGGFMQTTDLWSVSSTAAAGGGKGGGGGGGGGEGFAIRDTSSHTSINAVFKIKGIIGNCMKLT